MPNLSQRYIAALAQLSQFICVVGDKSSLTHVLTGVQVAPCSTDPDDDDAELLVLTYPSGHTVAVIPSMYLDLQLAEDAAHQLHSVGDEGRGDIHKLAASSWEHLARKHGLVD